MQIIRPYNSPKVHSETDISSWINTISTLSLVLAKLQASNNSVSLTQAGASPRDFVKGGRVHELPPPLPPTGGAEPFLIEFANEF